MNIKAKQILIVGAFIVLTLLGYILLPKDEIVINTENEISENISGEANTEKVIYVHIEGAVNNPGIKEVTEGTRLFELIEISDGLTEDADTSKVNLASVLKDEQKIYIPYLVKETVNSSQMVLEKESSQKNNSQKDNSQENNLPKNESNGKSNVDKNQININENMNFTGEIVNINTATNEELQTLSGIGPSMANKILEYRETNGYFNSIEDIKNVSGIGEAKYNKIKDSITV